MPGTSGGTHLQHQDEYIGSQGLSISGKMVLLCGEGLGECSLLFCHCES